MLVAFAAVVLASTGRAQNAPPAQARAPLDGWYGEMTWSFHHKEDTSTPPDHNRSEVKFDGRATARIYDTGRGGLLGILDGSQKIDTHWWSYSPPGSGIYSQVCRGSAPPTAVRARVEGSPPSGSHPLSLQLTDVDAKITPTLSSGGTNAWCNAAHFAQLSIDNGLTISGLVRSLQPVGDGTYRAEFHTSQPLLEVHWSIVLRPGYCGYGTDRGGLFAFGVTGAGTKIHASPSETSSSVAFAPNGSRLIYDRVMQVDGQIWFHVSPPGKPAGWVSSPDVGCRRPGEPPPWLSRPPLEGSARGTAALVAGARG